jgi:hypothetical protein
MKTIILDFILDIFPTTKDEASRCLNKATIIIFDSINILVADDEYVYYFGSKQKGENTLKFFYKYRSFISGKKAFVRDEKIIEVFTKKLIGISADKKSVGIVLK